MSDTLIKYLMLPVVIAGILGLGLVGRRACW